MSRQSANAAEGRVIATRPSLCLLLFVAGLLLAVFIPTAASAGPPSTLKMTGTNPPSSAGHPALSITPRIQGRDDGAIATVMPITRLPVGADVNPENQVDVYTNSSCTGTPVATGDVEELEGAGIEVEVLPDSTTTFWAAQTEAGEPIPSECSKNSVTYFHSSTAEPEGEPPAKEEPPAANPPAVDDNQPAAKTPAPPRIRTVPSGRANDNTPLITGSAPGAERVKIFGNAGCNGAAIANVSPEELGTGILVQVADNSTTEFAGVSVAGGKQSFCSPAATYVEDSTAPRTRITMGPGVKTRRRKAVFRFADISGDPVGAKFACKLDRRKWKPCSSPFKLRGLGYRRHVLRVRGTDSLGNSESKPAKRSFKVIH